MSDDSQHGTGDRQARERSANGWRTRDLPGFIGLIGPLWTRREETAWAYGLQTTAAHANPAGVVHGGLLTALADHMLSAVAWEAMNRRPCVTVQLDTHFVAPAPVGSFVEARGRVVRRSTSLVFVRGELAVGSEAVLIATAVLKVVGQAG